MRKPTVLLAEDDPPTRKLYTHILRDHGYIVVEAGDGVAAVAAVAKGKPDIVLLDIMMPDMDGIEACRRLRAQLGDSVPIVFLTALSEWGIVRNALDAGGDDFIIKSGDLKAFLGRVKSWSGPSDAEAAKQRRRQALAALEGPAQR